MSYYIGFRFGWVRVFGYGIRWADREVYRPLFSERTGMRHVLRIGPWSIAWLRPHR